MRQWVCIVVLMKAKNHNGYLQNERADERAELGYVSASEEPELCPGTTKYGSLSDKIFKQIFVSMPSDSRIVLNEIVL